jgi:Fe-S oxidoreductase
MSRKAKNRDRSHGKSEAGRPAEVISGRAPPALEAYLKDIRKGCTECGACTQACAFLTHYGTPKSMALGLDFSFDRHQTIAYECSLCGLCTAVCPEKLDPCRLFLEMRRLYVEGGKFDETAYRAILSYERRGTSALFSWYGLPRGCDTVFFPGCNLPGTRPKVTRRMFRHLQKIIPTIGIVLDCCTKPSHDLGRQAYFESMSGEMIAYLSGRGVKSVLVACPSCYDVFQHHGKGIRVRTAYEIIHESGGMEGAHPGDQEIVVHDPCALRNETSVHQAIRSLLTGMGLTVAEMEHCGKRTVCCGEGGMVAYVKPEFVRSWSGIRAREYGGRQVLTYCAGCAAYLKRAVPIIHIADLLYRPEAALSSNLKGARAPFTYLNRLLLKRRLKRELKAATSQVRRRRLDR